MRVRFAVVGGRPTGKKTRLQPSTCRSGMEVVLFRRHASAGLGRVR
jgi:hypothetical protein